MGEGLIIRRDGKAADEYHAHIVLTGSIATGTIITLTKDGKNYTGTIKSDNTCVIELPSWGTYAVTYIKSALISELTIASTATMSATTFTISGVSSCTPNGETVTPTDIGTIWLHCADISHYDSYTIAQIVADSTLMTQLANNDNAVAYMIRSTDAIMTACVSSPTAITAIGNANACMDAVINNLIWVGAIIGSPAAISALDGTNPKSIPPLSGYSQNGYVLSTNGSVYSDRYLWKGFDKSNSTTAENLPDGTYCQIELPTAIWLYKVESHNVPYTTKLQASADGINFVDITSVTFNTTFVLNNTVITAVTPRNKRFKYFRLVRNGYNSGFSELQLYGK